MKQEGMNQEQGQGIRQSYVLRVTVSGQDQGAVVRRLRASLKYLGRVFGIRCVHVCEDAPGMVIDQRTSQESENQQNVL